MAAPQAVFSIMLGATPPRARVSLLPPEMMRQKISLPAHCRAALALGLLAALLCAPATCAAQGEPQHEQLLNGLPITLAYRPGEPLELLKLRIESGAVFDLAGKEGEMALLADLLFPDPTTRDFVAEEWGGQLSVEPGYDHIDVTLSGRASEFERLADLLRTAVVSMRITADDVARLRAERIKAAQAASEPAAAIADRAIAARLFGRHPYARPIGGTPESLARIERNDLLLARDRFLTADNARLIAIGGVEPARALRAFRQFFGSWRKSEALVPATFRQPDPPDARTLVIPQANADTAEVRLALRGLARTDRDHVAAAVLAVIARQRWLTSIGASARAQLQHATVRHEARALAGFWQMSAQVPTSDVAQTLEAARATLRALASAPPTNAELEQARGEVAAALNQTTQPNLALADQWLDQDTYKLTNADEQRILNELTPADLQRVAARLFTNAAIATVAVGPPAELRAELARTASGVEVFGAPPPPTASKPAPKPEAQPRRP